MRRTKRAPEAEIQLRKALSHRPADLRTLYILYQCLEQQGKDKEAAAVLKRHKATERDVFRLTELWGQRLEKEPNNPDLLSEVGAILLRLGEGAQAGAFTIGRFLAVKEARSGS